MKKSTPAGLPKIATTKEMLQEKDPMSSDWPPDPGKLTTMGGRSATHESLHKTKSLRLQKRGKELTSEITQEIKKVSVVARQKDRRPCLLVMSGVDLGRLIGVDIARGDFSIGRSSDNTLQLDDLDISRNHTVIGMGDGGELWIEDLNSTNGVFVGDIPITKHKLRPGDKIRVGPHLLFQFSFYDDDEFLYHQKIHNRIAYDSLTGVANRRYFLETLRQELSFTKRHELPVSLAMLDIDHFKTVNDTYGHDVGDKVLVEFVNRIQKLTRDEDLFGRFGGEEFILLLKATGSVGARVVCERLRVAICQAPFTFGELEIPVSVSIGLISCSSKSLHHHNQEQIIKFSDVRLYAAKQNGRNRVESVVLPDTVDQ